MYEWKGLVSRAFVRCARRFGFVPVAFVDDRKAVVYRIDRQLDWHREVSEAILSKAITPVPGWLIERLALHDDYLLRQYHMVHGCFPVVNCPKQFGYVRPRPEQFGAVELPEYVKCKRSCY
ncbi:hypothetical protein F7U66_01870 [Vibrio parahaemolyticus]|nr:hypothetical protein [Vibrio parahaemolyticus]